MLDSDDESEHDAYMERVRNEGRERDEDDEEEGVNRSCFYLIFGVFLKLFCVFILPLGSSDEDFKPAEDGSDVAEEFDSDAGGSTDEDDEDDDGDKPKKDKEPPKEKKKKSSQRYNDEVGEEGRKQKRKRKVTLIDCATCPSIDWLIDCVTSWLIDWLIRKIVAAIDRLIDWLVVYWCMKVCHWLIDWLIGGLLVHESVPLIGWLID